MLSNGSSNKFVGPTTLMEYSIITSIAKFSCIIPATSVWPVRVGSAIKWIKINKRSTLKSDALNALIIILIDGPKCGTTGASYLIKQTLRSFGERKRVMQKLFCIIKKETFTQTSVLVTQTEILHVESESQTNKRLDITTSNALPQT